MEMIKAIEPIYQTYFNIKLIKKVEEQKKKNKTFKEQQKSFSEYLKEELEKNKKDKYGTY